MSKLDVLDVSSLLKTLLETLQKWVELTVVMLPNLMLALVILAVGVVVSRWITDVVHRVVGRVTDNEVIANLVGTFSRMGLLALASLWALGLLHLDKTVTSVLAGFGVLGIALGFAFQDIAANFMSGLLMALYRPFKVGDLLEVSNKQCRVVRIELRATEVETLDGLTMFVPNRNIFQNPIVNYTRTPLRRMDLNLGASYADDMEKVRSTVLAAVTEVPHRAPTREPEVFFQDFGESSILFQVRVWLADSRQPAYLAARSEAMIAIKKAFDRERIVIPFPTRTLDFGNAAVSGKPMEDVELHAVGG